jgi:hypothetical protein
VAGVFVARQQYHDIQDQNVRDRIRKEWNIETKAHERAMEHARELEKQWKEKEHEWKEKMHDWNDKENDWHRKEQNWEVKWKEMERQARKEAERIEKEKRDRENDWHRKEQNWKVEWKELERQAREEAERIEKEKRDRENDWHRKEQDWKVKWKDMERQAREEAERVEKEKWDREHMNLYWEDIQSGENCIAHKTKRYSARLANLLPGINALEACKATPLTIHGMTYDSPLECEDRVSDVFPSDSRKILTRYHDLDILWRWYSWPLGRQ